MDERIEKARGIYERAVFAGDRRGVDDAVLGLDAVDADVALARGRLLHARFLEAGDGVADPNELSLFERAAALYQRLGDTRSEGSPVLDRLLPPGRATRQRCSRPGSSSIE